MNQQTPTSSTMMDQPTLLFMVILGALVVVLVSQYRTDPSRCRPEGPRATTMGGRATTMGGSGLHMTGGSSNSPHTIHRRPKGPTPTITSVGGRW